MKVQSLQRWVQALSHSPHHPTPVALESSVALETRLQLHFGMGWGGCSPLQKRSFITQHPDKGFLLKVIPSNWFQISQRTQLNLAARKLHKPWPTWEVFWELQLWSLICPVVLLPKYVWSCSWFNEESTFTLFLTIALYNPFVRISRAKGAD